MSDFSLPDFTVPELQATNLMVPDYTLPDTSMPDPPVSDLLQPVIPSDLDILAGPESPVLDAAYSSNGIPIEMPETPEMSDESDRSDVSDVPAQNLPGTLDSSALSFVRDSPDNRQLPSDLAYDALHSTPDMTTRERHLGMLLLGLEGKVPGEGAEGTGQ